FRLLMSYTWCAVGSRQALCHDLAGNLLGRTRLIAAGATCVDTKLEHGRVRDTEQLLVKAMPYAARSPARAARCHASAVFPCADGLSAVIPWSSRALRHAK